MTAIYIIQRNRQDFDPRFYYKRYNWRTNFDFKVNEIYLTYLLILPVRWDIETSRDIGMQVKETGYIFDPFIQTPTNLFPIKYSRWGMGSRRDRVDGNIVAQMNNQGQTPL